MKYLEYVLVSVILLFLILISTMVFAGDLPDSKLTPGASRKVSLHTLCTTSTKLVRNVPQSLKKAVYASYGLTGNDRSQCKEGYEVDHLISLELGGSNEQANLWPQTFCSVWSAHVKDLLENKLHALVCSGKLSIKDAQTCISTNWINCYKETFK